MKAVDWLRFMQDQRDTNGKVVFTATELANASGMAARSLEVALGRLVKAGVICRYTSGRYGLPGAAGALDLVRSIDPAAYVTGMYALHRHRLITQMPAEIAAFTNRRHNRSRARTTPVGRLVFVCVTGKIYSPPADDPMAGPEHALCDYVYLCRRRGIAPGDIVTFRNLGQLDSKKLTSILDRYPASVRRDIVKIIGKLATK